MSEKELVISARKGDSAAFCALYDIYKNKLYHYAYYKLGDPQDAEDAVQNCVMSAFQQIGKLKKESAFASWIFKILHYTCANAISEQIRQRNTSDIDDYQNILSTETSDTYRSTELQEALGKLSEKERTVVLLSVVAGFKSKEIAEITGLTAGNVRQKLSRSLAKMRNELE